MDIFIINTNNADKIPDNMLKQFEHKSISHEQKRKEHCLSYLMLDRILKEVYHISISDRKPEFKNGKPFLKNKNKCFSLSHSKDYIVAAFSDYNCGIDIELIKERPYIKIAKRMNFQCNTLEEFYQAWTLFEAKYKLNDKDQSRYQFIYENYAISAVSSNIQEKFEIYVQNGEKFPNL